MCVDSSVIYSSESFRINQNLASAVWKSGRNTRTSIIVHVNLRTYITFLKQRLYNFVRQEMYFIQCSFPDWSNYHKNNVYKLWFLRVAWFYRQTNCVSHNNTVSKAAAFGSSSG